MYCTRVAGEIADEAVQIFGGRGITQGGMGGYIEMVSQTSPLDLFIRARAVAHLALPRLQFQRTQKFDAIVSHLLLFCRINRAAR